MNKVTIIEHPLVQHKISLLRDINTGSKEFRELVSETAMLMCYEATRDLPLKTVEVQTPVAIAKTKVISGRKLAFVPILRAGLGMVDGAVKLVPAAKIGHVGMFRDPDTKEAVQYYCKLPFDIAERDVIITDIMLATGGTAVKTIEILKNANAKSIKMMCIIASPEGIEAVHSVYPDVEIYCGSVDEKLDERLYIVPGLGDAGDRIFGTK
ncbi:MAG: uracil phosphoribosyltransferase [Oscillospiraceae bacterium]|nr:uracil phosphoribosyltransferase [Oscillospiraceae bacterium]MBQ3162736.1 uracil phosphoribosyltransferase [Oscillospiraceae bacterium]MBQ8786908.1 uracil phosphoribosyltransferase [Oscillospiraceae bacterium]